MAVGRRQPQYLTFKGWAADGLEVVATARLCVKTSTSTWVETGPLLLMPIPAARLLEDDICDAANRAHEARVQAEVAQARARSEAMQDPLF